MELLRRSGSQKAMRFLGRSAPSSPRSFVLGRAFSSSAKSSSSSQQSQQQHKPWKLFSFLFPAAAAASGFGAAVLLGSCGIASADAQYVDKSTPDSSIRDSMSVLEPTGAPVVTKSGRIVPKLQIFIGYDPREHVAYEVCRHSILKHTTMPVEITPIKQSHLRSSGLYTRSKDPTESTEFSFTRFLTPFLAGYEGWAMFVDCDFLYTSDIRELVELIDDRYAIMCVQHDYTPKSATKMDGVVQTSYPRKNWSSMVLYNCSHPKNRVLTPMVVNSQSGAFLHRFLWLDDSDIGSIPFTWNYLVGHNKMPGRDLPRAIHYTSGGPWFEAWKDCEYAGLWLQEREDFRHTQMIQKVIQDDILKLLSKRMDGREREIDGKLAELEDRLAEVTVLQRLLLHYLQDRLPSANSNMSLSGKDKLSLPSPIGPFGNGKELNLE